MTQTAIGPVLGDLTVYLDTDNAFLFPITDKTGARVDVTGWAVDLEVDVDFAHSAVKLTVAGSPVEDPDDASKTVLQVVIPADDLQPGTDDDQWNVTRAPLEFPYSVKRTDSGNEKELRVGKFIVKRARV